MRNTILFLAFISGVCGIAYEVLYTRLLSTYFGNIFYVSAAILISFLLSIGIGALVGHRFVRYISLIEITIGVYAIGAVFFFRNHALEMLSLISIDSTAFPFIFVGVAISFLIIPAFLIGFSIPIFSLYLAKNEKSKNSFSSVYILYNIGAALSVLVIEYILVRNFGLSASILSIAVVNIINGVILLFKVPLTTKIVKLDTNSTINTPYWITLFLVSVASGIFQLFLLRISNNIFGPINENFAIILFVALSGMAMATGISERKNLSYKKYLSYGALIVLVSCLLLTPFIYFWAILQEHFGILYSLTWIFKPMVIFMFSFAMLSFFGGTIPFLLKNNGGPQSIGKALAISCFGNVTGFLMMTFVFYEKISDSLIPVIISSLIVFSILIISGIKRIDIYFAIILVILSVFVIISWPYKLLVAGHTNLNSVHTLNTINSKLANWKEYKKFDSSVSILYFKDDSRLLSINGSVSLRFNSNNLTQLREMIVGLSPAIYSKNHDTALVLGLGSGISAGTVAKIYTKTKIIEINPAMLKGAEAFSEENMDILGNHSTTIVIQDGIVELLNSKEKYDTIVNTVTSPKYFSSSKLWTKEVFDAISTKLNEGGIYSMWLDLDTGTEGVQIMIKTVESSFLDCKYIYLNVGYLNVLCSNTPFVAKNISDTFWPEEILQKFRFYQLPFSINSFINNLTLDIENKLLYNSSTKYNTLDFPVLEFTRPVQKQDPTKSAVSFMANIVNSSIIYSPFEKKLLSKDQLFKRCISLKIIETSPSPKAECSQF
jgi:spermidine synthase